MPKNIVSLFFLFVNFYSLFSYSDVGSKSEKKMQARWTLAEWLEQKERNKMMDLWLQMHSISPYEFGLAASKLSYESNSKQFESNKYEFFAFAGLTGIEAKNSIFLDENLSDFFGLFKVRVLGNSQEDTHLNVGLGQLQRNFVSGGTFFKALAYQIEWAIYLSHYFGFAGEYSEILRSSSSSTQISVNRLQREVGIFLNFSFLQLFGNVSFEQTRYGFSDEVLRSGYEAGAILYF